MDRRTKFVIAALMLTGFMIGTDFTGALLLVTPIEREFGVDITTTQWVLNVYALTYAVFMVGAGRLGDMYGRRGLMLVGLGVFFVASVLCLAAPSMAWLIGFRGVQGIGAAIIWPCLLAYGATAVDKDKRALALGLLLAGITGGNVIGPLIGGIVAGLGDWRLFFLVNATLAVVSAILILRFLAKDKPEKVDERVDLAGMTVLGLAVLALLYGLDVGGDWGWSSARLLGVLAVSVVLFAAFPFVEARVADPMWPVVMMKNRAFMLTLLANGLQIPAIFIAFLYFPQFMQAVLGWSVLQASFGMLPLMVLTSVGSIVAGRLYEPVGPKRLLLAGFGLVALGAASIVALQSSWGYVAILPAMILLAAGAVLSIGTAGTAAVGAATASRAGIATGLSFMVHLILGAVGVAGATAIMSAETAGKGGAGLSDAFAIGLSDAYWLALVAALIGLAACTAIDETKLHGVDD